MADNISVWQGPVQGRAARLVQTMLLDLFQESYEYVMLANNQFASGTEMQKASVFAMTARNPFWDSRRSQGGEVSGSAINGPALSPTEAMATTMMITGTARRPTGAHLRIQF